MSGATLCLHTGAKEVDRAELARVEVPQATATWFPVGHNVVVEEVEQALDLSGFQIERAQYALSHQGARFFGALDLVAKLIPGVSLAVGIRNSMDKVFPRGFLAG